MLAAFGERRGLAFELAVQRQVVAECQELADDNQRDDREQRPKNDRVELSRLGFFDRGHEGGRDHRRIGQDQAPLSRGNRHRRCAGERRRRRSSQRGDRHQEVACGPPDVNDAAGAVLVGCRQVGKAAIGQQVGEQTADQQEER